MECNFTQVATNNQIITKFHNIDHDRIVTQHIKSDFRYSFDGFSYRPDQNETCHQSVDQLCHSWVQRLYDIDKGEEERNMFESIHACQCLRYRHALNSGHSDVNTR